jgi:hypothetical protein
MRHFPTVLCVSATLGYASLAAAGTNPLAFTLDLTAPCTGGVCSGTHPTDVALNLNADTFSYQVDSNTPSAYIARLDVSAPTACDEISSENAAGPVSNLRFSPNYTNPSPGGLLEFGTGGATVVDLGVVSYDGSSPAGVTAVYNNAGAPQVTCYKIAPLTGGPIVRGLGPTAIFVDGFGDMQDTHFVDEPWLSVQTVVSPQSAARRGGETSGITPANALGYVIEVHNASAAAGWRLNLGYDYAFFDPKNGDGTVLAAPKWCVLGAGIPQPGPISGSATCSSAGTTHTFATSDIAPGNNSIFVYAEYSTSVAGSTAWTSLTAASYPAVAALFPPFGHYPQRFDDKVSVVGPNNRPVLNVGSIIASNSTSATSATLRNRDGNALPAALTFQNAVSGSGAATIDPIAYFVNPNGNTTLPGTGASDAITVSNVSCDDPQGVLGGGIGAGNFSTSTAARGGLALNFNFAPSGGLFVPGTATCTAKFTASGYSPALSTTGTFSITMQQATATHFAVTAAPAAVAGTPLNGVIVSALDAANNVVATYNGTVHFSSTDTAAVPPPNATLSNGTGTFSVTFKTSGGQTISANDTVAAINGTSPNISVAAAPATHFRVSAPAAPTSGTQFSFAVTALDQFNNTDDNYAGTVHFTSTDGAAVLPADGVLTFGIGSFPATLNTTGAQTITATDTVTSSIAGTSGTIAVQ